MHKAELIRDNGDYLEKNYADKILCRVEGYGLFWATYIGNDGKSNYLPMPGVSPEVLHTRTRIWEHLYTLFESLAFCWRLEERFSARNGIASATDYVDNLNDWIAFYGHLGRIYDMAQKVAEEFQRKELIAPFDPFYKQRHIVLHYPKVPMCWVDNVLVAPMLGEGRQNWKKGMRWTEMNSDDFHFVSDIVDTTLRELEKVVNKFFFNISEFAASEKAFVSIQWPSPREIKKQENSRLSVSGFNSIGPDNYIQPSGTRPFNPPSDSSFDD